MANASRRVLMSTSARDALAQRLAALAPHGALEVLTLDEAGTDPTCTVHAAFISRDITGASTKTTFSAGIEATYALLGRSPDLQWVHTHSAGADRPIYGELRARGVAVSTSAGANAAVVAQTALGALLALARRSPQFQHAQQVRRWAPLANGMPPPDLEGQTVVLVGWGQIARRLQPWLAMLGLRVIVVRRSPDAAAPGVETLHFGALGDALPQADWLVLTCALNAQTRRLADAAALARLKRGAMIVNVARGEVIDEAALVAALQSGHVGGAALDVFEIEPLPAGSPLWSLPQVMVMPHSGGQAAGNAARVASMFADNLERWLAGRVLHNAVE